MSESDGNWDIVITSLQDICNSHVSVTFDNVYSKYAQNPALIKDLTQQELDLLRQDINDHKANVATAQRLIANAQLSLRPLVQKLLGNLDGSDNNNNNNNLAVPATALASGGGSNTAVTKKRQDSSSSTGYTRSKSPHNSFEQDSPSLPASKPPVLKKHGRLYFVSKFNPLEPIFVGSDVAYKLRNRHFEEWIQCEVMRVFSDGVRFEIRDPEPDENNNPGQTFKAGYREILLIPVKDTVKKLPVYPYGTKVLARYPETTTFYTAIVIGTKKDGRVRLKFDGEEEVNKETEVERRLVLAFPDK